MDDGIVHGMGRPLKFVTLLCATILLSACGTAPSASNDRGGSETSPSATSTPTTSPAPKEAVPLKFNASGILGGTASPSLPDGTKGQISVVQLGTLDRGLRVLPFVFRNDENRDYANIQWSATVRSNGAIVASGSSHENTPSLVRSGELGLGSIYFDNADAIPDGAQYEFSINRSALETGLYHTADLKITEANNSGGSIVGTAQNRTGHELMGGPMIGVYCFDGDKVISQMTGFTDQQGRIADQGTVSFSVNLMGANCPTFAVGASGYLS